MAFGRCSRDRASVAEGLLEVTALQRPLLVGARAEEELRVVVVGESIFDRSVDASDSKRKKARGCQNEFDSDQAVCFEIKTQIASVSRDQRKHEESRRSTSECFTKLEKRQTVRDDATWSSTSSLQKKKQV